MRLSISNVALLVLGFQSTVFGRAIPEALSHAGNSARECNRLGFKGLESVQLVYTVRG